MTPCGQLNCSSNSTIRSQPNPLFPRLHKYLILLTFRIQLQLPPSFVIHPSSADPAFHQPLPISISLSITSPVLGEVKACILDCNITGAGYRPPSNGAMDPELDRSNSGSREDRLSDPDRKGTDSDDSSYDLMDSNVDDLVDSFSRSSVVQQEDSEEDSDFADEISDINDAAADSENRSLYPNTRAARSGHTDSTISETDSVIRGRNLMNRAQGSSIGKAEHDHAEDSEDLPIDSKTTGTNTAPGRQQTRYRLRNITKTGKSTNSINRGRNSERSGDPVRDLPASGSGHSEFGRILRSGQLQNPFPGSQRSNQVLPASNNNQSLILCPPVVQNSITDKLSQAERPDAAVTIKPDQQSLENLVSNILDKKLAEAQARIVADAVRSIMAPDDRDNLGSDEDMPGDDRRVTKTRAGRIRWDHKADIHLMLALVYEMNPEEENWLNIHNMLRKYGFGDCKIASFKQHLVRLGRKHQPDNRYRGNRILPDRNERPAPLLPAGEYDQPDDQPCDQRGDKPARGKKRAAPTCATDCEIGYYRVDQVPEASWDADMPSEDEHDSLKKRAKRDESDEQDGLASVPRPGNSLPRPVEYDDNDGFSRARREVLGSTGTHVGYAHDARGHTAYHEYPAGGMGHQGNPPPGSFWDLSQDLPAPTAPGRLPVFGEQQPLAPIYGGRAQRPYQYGPGHYYRGPPGGAYQPPMNQYHHPMVQYQPRPEYGQPQPYQQQQRQPQSGFYNDEEHEERRQRNR